MPDIAMCSNSTCPRGEFCYRYRAIPDPQWQAYSSFTPDDEAGRCEHFEPILEGDAVSKSPSRHKPKKGKQY